MVVLNFNYLLYIDFLVINLGGVLNGWKVDIVVKSVIVDELGKINLDG